MSGRLDASVVIATRGGEGVIARQLACLAEQTHDRFEVLIADNGRSAGYGDVVAAWRDRLELRVVDARSRVGCGHARNVGYRAAATDRLLFCDDGDHVARTWVAGHLEALADADVATGPKATVHAGRLSPAERERAFAVAEFSNRPNDLGVRPYASGGNSSYRRTTLDAIGGFGTHNLRREDVEASWLAQDLGFTLAFAPEARLLYVAREGARARFRQSFGYGVGEEALRRQLDPAGTRMIGLGTAGRAALVGSLRRPGRAPALLGGLSGRLVERALPGRHFEHVRRQAAVADLEHDESTAHGRPTPEGAHR